MRGAKRMSDVAIPHLRQLANKLSLVGKQWTGDEIQVLLRTGVTTEAGLLLLRGTCAFRCRLRRRSEG